MTDDNPEGVSARPSDARLIADAIRRMQAQTLPPGTPKGSTSSFATTGNGGATPMRVADIDERRRTIQSMTPQENPTAKFWREAEERNKAQEAKWAKDEQDKQDAIRRELEERKAAVERQLAIKKAKLELENAAATLDLCLAHLTDAEQRRVREKLANENRIYDYDRASYYASIEVMNRGNLPAEKGTPVLDWRGFDKELANSKRVLVRGNK